jgi:3-oxoacyl-[acyl-carrier-protein] synthase II
MTTDARPSSPESLVRAMREAIQHAPGDGRRVDLVFAEGDATLEGDRVETRALAKVVGRDTPVTCTKGAYGHLLGASGATEAAIGLMALRTGRIPPIAGFERADPDVDISLVREPLERRARTLLVNARSRQGANVALFFREG